MAAAVAAAPPQSAGVARARGNDSMVSLGWACNCSAARRRRQARGSAAAAAGARQCRCGRRDERSQAASLTLVPHAHREGGGLAAAAARIERFDEHPRALLVVAAAVRAADADGLHDASSEEQRADPTALCQIDGQDDDGRD